VYVSVTGKVRHVGGGFRWDFFFPLAFKGCSGSSIETGSRKWVKVSVSLNKLHTHKESLEEAHNYRRITLKIVIHLRSEKNTYFV